MMPTTTACGALPNDDADNDGVPNAVEMVLGGDPKNSMDVKLLPELELVTDPGEGVPAGDYLKFTYRRTQLSVDAGLIAACEYGSDLVSEWTPVVSPYPEGVVVLEDKPFAPYSTIALTDRVRVFVPRAGSAKLFGRLRVTVP